MSDTSGRSVFKKLSVYLRIAVAVAAVVILCISQDWGKLAGTFSHLSPVSVIIALLCFSAGNLIIGQRWYILLRAQNIDVRFFPTLRIHFVGLFYNNVLLSSVGGDMLRAWYVSRHTNRRFEAALSVLVDRFIGLLTLVFMAFMFYWFYPVNASSSTAPPPSTQERFDIRQFASEHSGFIAGIGIFVLVVIAGLIILPRTRRLFVKFYNAVMARRGRLMKVLGLYLRRPGVIALSVFLTVIAQGVVILGIYSIGESLGVPVSLKYYFVLFPISWVIGAIPISPGGYGVLELSIVGLFLLLPGVTTEQATALALSQRIAYIISSLPGILIHIGGFHLPAELDSRGVFFVDSDTTGK